MKNPDGLSASTRKSRWSPGLRLYDRWLFINKVPLNVLATCVLLILGCARAAASDVYLFITIDTETSSGCHGTSCHPDPISHRILGIKDDKYYGIGLIMDLLEKHGMRGTFFVNGFLDAAYPENEIVNAIRPIAARGHDVELHTHEEFRCFKFCAESDMQCRNNCIHHISVIPGNTYRNQLQILKEGADNVARWSGLQPIAFRGGSFHADETTLKALRSLGIWIDSSLDGPTHVLAKRYPVNKVADIDGTVEIPMTNFVTLSLGPYEQTRMLDFASNTVPEMLKVIDEAKSSDMRVVMLLLHSFTFCRELAQCPDNAMIGRFDRLLASVSMDRDVHVITVRQFAGLYRANPHRFTGSGALPKTGYLLTLWRSYERFNDGWQNQVFFLGNVLFGVVGVIGLSLAIRRAMRP